MLGRLKLETWLHARREAWRAAFVSGRLTAFLFEFIAFGLKNAWACLFGGVMLALLIGTFLFYPREAPFARFDFLTIAALMVQASMLATRLETWAEARVIFAFHVVGTIMEVFKTGIGSWIYPEASLLRIAGVPLFSGFMYAAVGSYIARIWRIFDFQFKRFPPLWLQGVLTSLVYANFFTHHYLPDIRLGLIIFAVAIYGPCTVYYRPDLKTRSMPLAFGLLLVAVFIWFAENLGTFARAWVYPAQQDGWRLVSFAKLGSWYLLMIISFVLVAAVHGRRRPATSPGLLASRRSSSVVSRAGVGGGRNGDGDERGD